MLIPPGPVLKTANHGGHPDTPGVVIYHVVDDQYLTLVVDFNFATHPGVQVAMVIQHIRGIARNDICQ